MVDSAEDHQGATCREEHDEAVGKEDLRPATSLIQAILIIVAAVHDVFTEVSNFLNVGTIGENTSSQATGVINTEVRLFESSFLLKIVHLGLNFGRRVEPGEVERPEYKGDPDEEACMSFDQHLMGLRFGLDHFVSVLEGLHFRWHCC